jgi:hypothetical protein
MASTGQARTILGPLTTTFTPAPACFTPVIECPLPTCNVAWQAQTCYSSSGVAGVEDNTDCWPPRSGSVALPPYNPIALNGWGFYSPGLVCPSGYTSACSATGGGSWGWSVQYSIFVEETAIGCCPRYKSQPSDITRLQDLRTNRKLQRLFLHKRRRTNLHLHCCLYCLLWRKLRVRHQRHSFLLHAPHHDRCLNYQRRW